MSVRRLIMGVLTFALVGIAPRVAEANSIQFALDCIITTTGCTPSATYGYITLTDHESDVSIAEGDLRLSVSLEGSGETFRDLLLNYDPVTEPGAESITSSDSQAQLGEFTISPYVGTFNLGDNDGQGWSGSDPYTTILYGWNTTSPTGTTSGTSNYNLSLDDFLAMDSLEQIFGAIHIQGIGPGNCDGSTPCEPGTTGSGSIKVGARLITSLPPSVPEPAALFLICSGAALVVRRLSRMRRGGTSHAV